ncbi:hypothetical protein QE370_000470 [Aeromicrobium sp. SORGH_AS981]|uniref:hypothetical protein n=1 Tax=Aeromicrobium sp. SORGH_AS_0981 TaxID=3041802 RepID=UPI00286586B4|nr:hypothetical protein [Aeromicrobium sp. SORGH_AS_0981]MDR6117286.1 hypothetical protein [Aeromicrobium sp. SORGH_AS_0981]
MALPAIENYTDEKLDELLNAILALKEKRERLRRVPEQLAEQARTFVADGGDAETLRTALDVALEPTPADVEETPS